MDSDFIKREASESLFHCLLSCKCILNACVCVRVRVCACTSIHDMMMYIAPFVCKFSVFSTCINTGMRVYIHALNSKQPVYKHHH